MEPVVTHPRLSILYVALAHDYGERTRGRSFEHWNFYDSLRNMGHEITYFDFAGVMRELGKEGMNALLRQTVDDIRPDVLFAVLFNDELEQETLIRISRQTDTVTICWFCDDQWRFDGLSKFYAPCFDWSVTTANSALPKYEAMGYQRAIKSQWAANHFLYTPSKNPPVYDVTFVGMAHGHRPQTLRHLAESDVRVGAWGMGWPAGRLTQMSTIEVFARSKVNLNLSNASTVSEGDLPQQIKGRNFEIPACGGFQLSGQAEDIHRYFEPDHEIVIFDDDEHLVERAKYFLAHDEERQAIAEAGHRRVLAEHTYVHRFNDIFSHIVANDAKAAAWTGASRSEPPRALAAEWPRKTKRGYPNTSILMLNYNGREHIEKCLTSIRRYTDVPYELVIIDNASTDGSREYLRGLKYANMTLVENEENIGCPPARSQGLSLARGDYILFLDNDTIVTPGWLRRFVEHFEDNPAVGVAGPLSNYVSGMQLIPAVPYKTFEEMVEFAADLAHEQRGRLAHAYRLIGFCLFFRRDVVDRIGTCDSRFGKYGFEDDDFTWRAVLAGYDAMIFRDIFIHHTGGRGDSQQNPEYTRLVTEAWNIFRSKWRLPGTMSFRQYIELSAFYRLTRDFDHDRDYIPLPDVASLESRIVRRATI